VPRRPAKLTAEWIELKHQQLDDHEVDTIGIHVMLTELQEADIYITRLWMHTLFWQLAMSRCLLSSEPSSSSHEAMSLVFPVKRLSAQLRRLVTRLQSKTSVGMHWAGYPPEVVRDHEHYCGCVCTRAVGDGHRKGHQRWASEAGRSALPGQVSFLIRAD
jgi:hypothetical protein